MKYVKDIGRLIEEFTASEHTSEYDQGWLDALRHALLIYKGVSRPRERGGCTTTIEHHEPPICADRTYVCEHPDGCPVVDGEQMCTQTEEYVEQYGNECCADHALRVAIWTPMDVSLSTYKNLIAEIEAWVKKREEMYERLFNDEQTSSSEATLIFERLNEIVIAHNTIKELVSKMKRGRTFDGDTKDKEFLDWLEMRSHRLNSMRYGFDDETEIARIDGRETMLGEVLSKFKEIIGGKNDERILRMEQDR